MSYTTPDAAGIRLSVIIPTVEFDDYLREAVTSVVADLSEVGAAELIVVRDGRQQAIPTWMAAFDAVRVVFTGSRRGTAAALNLGIRGARGDVIGRLDSDDVWTAGRAKAQLVALDSASDLVLVTGAGTVIDGAGAELGVYPPPQPGDLRRELLTRNPIIHSGVMFSKAAWQEVGGYDERLFRMQDYDLWLRLATIGRLEHHAQQVVKYRVHDGQSSRHAKSLVRTIRTITQGRLALASLQGCSRGQQHIKDAIFTAAQLLRYAGIRRPRHLTAARPAGVDTTGLAAKVRSKVVPR